LTFVNQFFVVRLAIARRQMDRIWAKKKFKRKTFAKPQYCSL
jgi:hypothetical protein